VDRCVTKGKTSGNPRWRSWSSRNRPDAGAYSTDITNHNSILRHPLPDVPCVVTIGLRRLQLQSFLRLTAAWASYQTSTRANLQSLEFRRAEALVHCGFGRRLQLRQTRIDVNHTAIAASALRAYTTQRRQLREVRLDIRNRLIRRHIHYTRNIVDQDPGVDSDDSDHGAHTPDHGGA